MHAYGHKTNPSNKRSPTKRLVTFRGQQNRQIHVSHCWNVRACTPRNITFLGQIFQKPTYYKTLSVIVSSAAYELSRSASYEIVGHIFGTNLGKNGHTTRLFRFLSHSPPMLFSYGNSRTVDTKQTPPTYTVPYIGLTRHDSHSADFICNTTSIKNNTQ